MPAADRRGWATGHVYVWANPRSPFDPSHTWFKGPLRVGALCGGAYLQSAWALQDPNKGESD